MRAKPSRAARVCCCGGAEPAPVRGLRVGDRGPCHSDRAARPRAPERLRYVERAGDGVRTSAGFQAHRATRADQDFLDGLMRWDQPVDDYEVISGARSTRSCAMPLGQGSTGDRHAFAGERVRCDAMRAAVEGYVRSRQIWTPHASGEQPVPMDIGAVAHTCIACGTRATAKRIADSATPSAIAVAAMGTRRRLAAPSGST